MVSLKRISSFSAPPGNVAFWKAPVANGVQQKRSPVLTTRDDRDLLSPTVQAPLDNQLAHLCWQRIA